MCVCVCVFLNRLAFQMGRRTFTSSTDETLRTIKLCCRASARERASSEVLVLQTGNLNPFSFVHCQCNEPVNIEKVVSVEFVCLNLPHVGVTAKHSCTAQKVLIYVGYFPSLFPQKGRYITKILTPKETRRKRQKKEHSTKRNLPFLNFNRCDVLFGHTCAWVRACVEQCSADSQIINVNVHNYVLPIWKFANWSKCSAKKTSGKCGARI